MNKKVFFLIVFFMALSILVPNLDVNAATSELEVLFNNNGDASTTGNTINANFKLINKGSVPIDLADIKLRYYYTADSDKEQNFYCDHAGMLNGWDYTSVTDKVTGTINRMNVPTADADSYFEVGFNRGAGVLSPNGYIEIQTRVARTDWSNYDLSNDYSFAALSTYDYNDKITAYLKETLIFGSDCTVNTPLISPTSATYDKYVGFDVLITLTPEGNTFKGIVGLEQGKDYEVSGNSVVLKKEYLNSLPIGNVNLTFDFGSSYNPQLALTVKDTTPTPFDAKIGTATGKPGDTVTVPVSFENVAKAGKIGVLNFYIRYDNTLLEALSVEPGTIVPNSEYNFASNIDSNNGVISFIFLDNTIGDEMIESDGDFAKITFKIKPTAQETTTPVEFKEIPMQFDDYGIPGPRAKAYNGSVVIKTPSYATISPTYVKQYPGLIEDIVITFENNGCDFQGIYGLTRGQDYIVQGNKIIISKAYLATMAVGTKQLTFNFGLSNNPILFIDTANGPSAPTSVRIGKAKGIVGDTVTVPVTLSNVRWVGAISTFNFYVGYDNTLLEAVSVEPGDIIKNPNVNFGSRINSDTGTISAVFLDNTLGDEFITTDGIIANITFKILKNVDTEIPIVFKDGQAFGDAQLAKIREIYFYNGSVSVDKNNMFNISVGNVSGNEGEIVAVPISFENIAKISNIRYCDFKVSYDTTLLEAVSVEPGTIATNAGSNFQANINTTSGEISLIFNSIEEDQCIMEDGVFANINFKLNRPSVAKTTTPVEIKEIGTFSDQNLNQVPVADADGSVTIIRTSIIQSEINPSSISYVLGSSYNIKVELTPNGNKFIGISGLKAGTDYSVSGNTVTLQNSYLNSLEVGTKQLVFDFGTGDINPILEIAVNVGTPAIITNSFAVYKNEPKELYVTIAPNGNAFNGIVGLEEGTDYAVSDNIVKLYKDYIAKLPVGNTTLTFDFGITNNPTMTICVEIWQQYTLDVEIGTAEGAQGDTVTVPITLSNVKDVNNVGTFNFYMGYDNTLLKAVSVEPGDVIINPSTNFTYKINDNTGTISFIFLDCTIGDELITTDGILANVKFNILGTSNTETPLVFKDGGAFGNGNMAKINNVSLTNGSVNIMSTTIPEYKINPSNESFALGSTDNLEITITPDVNDFNGIVGLTEGVDYTITGNTVTILNSYLNTLQAGTKTLTFDFGLEENPVLDLEIINPSVDSLCVEIGTATGKAGDYIIVPVSFKNVSQVGNIGTCNFYLGYDVDVLKAVDVTAGNIVWNAPVNFSARISDGRISFVFLDNTLGDELITQDGVFANIMFQVKEGACITTDSLINYIEGGAFGDGTFSKIGNVVIED